MKSFKRYEILLPIRYNDGILVEPEKFYQTREELVVQFGALTTCPELYEGTWIFDQQKFEDSSVRLYVDVEASPEHRAFFVRFKETLKSRFRQLDIWIVSYDIEIL